MKKELVREKDRTCEPSVMTADEAMAWLDSKGISYEVCDTPVPLLGNVVNCGSPLQKLVLKTLPTTNRVVFRMDIRRRSAGCWHRGICRC